MDSLYDILGCSKNASTAEIKRAYRTLRTKLHPDKQGGDARAFHRLVAAFNVLSDADKRAHYDATGEVQKSASDEFVERFGGGSFADKSSSFRRTAAATTLAASVSDQIAIRQAEAKTQSHTAGFEAWLRSRGGLTSGASVYTAETIAENFGVVKSSYEGVPLPARSVLKAVCRGPGRPQEQVQLVAEELAPELEWGQVFIEVKLAPVTPADLYSMRLGGLYDDQSKEPPFVAGHDAVAVVAKVGPGVKDLTEGDVVLPTAPLQGTFTQAAVVKAKQWVRVGKLASLSGPQAADTGSSSSQATKGPESAVAADELPLPLEYLAIHRELALAYRLLEAHTGLKPGDCVILNAPNSTVGRSLLQLCKLLGLRSLAVLRCQPRQPATSGAPQAGAAQAAAAAAEARFEATAAQLKALGATLVLKDEASIKVQLQAERFFGKPKLALDAVGGESAARLADALEQGGRLVVYGCLSGKAPTWPWQAWVFRGLQVSGFNLRTALAADTPKGAEALGSLLASLGKLVSAGLLTHDFCAYSFEQEWAEAVEHAIDAPGGSRVLLQM